MPTIDEMVKAVAKQEALKTVKAMIRRILAGDTPKDILDGTPTQQGEQCGVCERHFKSPHAVRIHHSRSECGDFTE